MRSDEKADVVGYERPTYQEAADRAHELRELGEHHLERARAGLDVAPGSTIGGVDAARGAAVLGLAIACALLEVSARLELLELDAELAREESDE